MQYIFERQYVTPENKGFLKGSAVPEDFPKSRLERLIESGIISIVESLEEFVAGADISEIENLDPERKPRGKRG